MNEEVMDVLMLVLTLLQGLRILVEIFTLAILFSIPYVSFYLIFFYVFKFKRVNSALIALVVTLALSFVLIWLMTLVSGFSTYYSFFPWTDCVEEYGSHCPPASRCLDSGGGIIFLICRVVKLWQIVSLLAALAVIIVPPIIRRFRVGKKGDRLKG